MSIYVILTIIFFIASVAGLWGMFEKAGEPGWKILIPLYNFYVWLKIIDKPLWWYIFLLIPFINVFTVMLMVVEYLKNFHKFSLGQQALAVIFPYIYLPYLGFSKKETFTPTSELPKIRKTWIREWVDAIIFAVIAATIIRTFLVEAYTIPTSSMEKSMLVGDFLFVSKIAYGPKVPNTPLSIPFMHHSIPGSNMKSYVEWIKLPYYRFPGLSEIERKDVVVFNFPAGDTVVTNFPAQTYNSIVRQVGREAIWNNPQKFGKVVYRPVDKRENYVKRCVAMPGDSLEIVDQHVYINNNKQKLPEGAQFRYRVETKGGPIHPRFLDKNNITEGDTLNQSFTEFMYVMTDEAKKNLERLPIVTSVDSVIQEQEQWNEAIFPHDPNYKWTLDNFGPLYIPEKGKTVQLNNKNIALYERIIDVYENNDLEIRNSDIYINGEKADTYTFKMDYFWMMGDNRHNSLDSRYWGFVPMDHIVGKASFVWLSLDYSKRGLFSKIRFNKMFRPVK
ncbi:MAG: signal peptidase I [Bacteroidales bacterium]